MILGNGPNGPGLRRTTTIDSFKFGAMTVVVCGAFALQHNRERFVTACRGSKEHAP